MNNKIKNRFLRLAFLLNGLIFLFAGAMLISDNKVVFGILQLLASILNLSMIIHFRNENAKKKIEYAILIANIIVSLSIAIDYILSGKLYIQYMWIMAAVMSAIAVIIQVKREKRLTDKNRINNLL